MVCPLLFGYMNKLLDVDMSFLKIWFQCKGNDECAITNSESVKLSAENSFYLHSGLFDEITKLKSPSQGFR